MLKILIVMEVLVGVWAEQLINTNLAYLQSPINSSFDPNIFELQTSNVTPSLILTCFLLSPLIHTSLS